MTVKARHSRTRQSTQDCNKPPTLCGRRTNSSSRPTTAGTICIRDTTSTALRFGIWQGLAGWRRDWHPKCCRSPAPTSHSSTCQPVVFHSSLTRWSRKLILHTCATHNSSMAISNDHQLNAGSQTRTLTITQSRRAKSRCQGRQDDDKGNNADQVLLRGRCDVRWGGSACPSKETHGCCELLLFTMHKCRR